MFSPCFSAPPRLRVKQHLSNSTRSQPRRNSRRAEGEVRRNLILGPCLPSPCQHRNAPDQLRYPPRAALVRLPPQREPRCEALRSPLSPRSQVLTFLRSLASTETNPEKMFSACFSAPPRLRVKQHLSNSTRSRPRRNSRRLALSARLRTAVARRIGKAWSAHRRVRNFCANRSLYSSPESTGPPGQRTPSIETPSPSRRCSDQRRTRYPALGS